MKAKTVQGDGRDINDYNNPCLSVDNTGDNFEDYFWKEFFAPTYP